MAISRSLTPGQDARKAARTAKASCHHNRRPWWVRQGGSKGIDHENDLLVDGIRHGSICRLVVDLVKPSRTCLLYLSAADDIRAERTAVRGDVNSFSAETHIVEADLVTTLPDMADAVIDASRPFNDVFLDCLDVLSGFGVDPKLIASCQEEARKQQ